MWWLVNLVVHCSHLIKFSKKFVRSDLQFRPRVHTHFQCVLLYHHAVVEGQHVGIHCLTEIILDLFQILRVADLHSLSFLLLVLVLLYDLFESVVAQVVIIYHVSLRAAKWLQFRLHFTRVSLREAHSKLIIAFDVFLFFWYLNF